MGEPEAAQHMGQAYSHLPHTEPSYPKQNEKEQKQRVSKSTAGEQAQLDPSKDTSHPQECSHDSQAQGPLGPWGKRLPCGD